MEIAGPNHKKSDRLHHMQNEMGSSVRRVTTLPGADWDGPQPADSRCQDQVKANQMSQTDTDI